MSSKKPPDVSRMSVMRDRPGVRFGVVGAAFLNRFHAMLEPLSLTPSRVLALAYVLEHPGCGQTSLAEVMNIGRASAMLLVDKFETLGYLERRAGPDRRSNALFVTKAGSAAFEKAQEADAALSEELFGWMTHKEQEKFFAIIDEISKRTKNPVKKNKTKRAVSYA